MALIPRNGGSQSPDRWLKESRNNQQKWKILKIPDSQISKPVSVYTSSANEFRFPLKGAITRSSSTKTNGIYCDYKAASGTPVYAPCDGTVIIKQSYATNYGKLASYGNNLDFTSSDGKYNVKMAHLQRFNGITVRYTSSLGYPCGSSKYSCSTITLASKNVKQGDLLGYTGMTGNASGPHLHLEVKKNGTPVDPASTFKSW